MLPTVAHLKDHFLPKSETFIYTLIANSQQYQPIILNRYQAQNRDLFPLLPHFSPATKLPLIGSYAERLSLRAINFSPYLEWIIHQQNVSIVHAHFGQLGALFYPIAKRHGVPIVTSFYGKDASVFLQNKKWQLKFSGLWKNGNIFCVLGPNMARVLEASGCPGNKIVVLPLCIDINKFSFTPHAKPAPEDNIKLLTVGRLIPKKGVDILLKSLSKCPKNIQLFIAGDGPERKNLENLSHSLGIENRVIFLGWVTNDQIAKIMNETNIFVLASHTDSKTGETEGTPTVLLEAQARGMLVITTRHADTATIVNDPVQEFLVPENDARALANSIQKAISLPSEKWLEFSQIAREFVVKTHDSRVVISRLENIYDSLVKM